jgi:hypothetical protein
MQEGKFLDGGATIAADGQGHVYALWHAMPKQASPAPGKGELARTVYVASSDDDGQTFTKEAPRSEAVGLCGCCSMRAITLASGELVALYRSADGSSRGMQLLRSSDHGVSFKASELQPWPINACPMSSSFLKPTARGLLAAWETDTSIWLANLSDASIKPRKISTQGSKHPSLAENEHGETLVAWARGTGWQRGGTLAWCVVDAAGKVMAESAADPDKDANAAVPVWSFPAAAEVAGLGFVVVH